MAARTRKATGDQETVTVHFRSFESLALGEDLDFPPPLAERSPYPEAFTYQWKLLQYAFRLPDPSSFPPMPAALDPADLGILQRYCEAADDMAESVLLSAPQSMTLRAERESGREEIERSLVSKKSPAGSLSCSASSTPMRSMQAS